MPSTVSPHSNPTARLWWTLVGVGLLDWSFRIVSSAPQFGWAALTALLAGSWGMGTVLVSWVPQISGGRLQRYGNLFAWATAVIGVLSFVAWAAISVHNSPAYGTDELAFDQYSAWLVQHGFNPYTHPMGRAFEMFRVSPGGYTYTLSGGQVTQLSYPALSFLLYLPFLLLGWSKQLGVGLDVVGWVIATLLTFKLLPRDLRPAALILGSAMAYVQLSVIGLTDMAFMPMLILAAYRWDRFGTARRYYVGPVMLGLAMCVKQTPWPILPFVLIALTLDERARTSLEAGLRRAARYLLVVLIAFLIPNLPFLLQAPSAWVHGSLTPVIRSLVPAGQGAIGFSLFLHIGGGSLRAYTLLMALVFVLLLVSYVGTYPLLRATTFALPAVAYFFGVRSYTDYLLALVPPGLVAAITADMVPAQLGTALLRSRRWAYAIAGSAALCALTAIYVVTSGPPLKMTIVDATLVGQTNIAQNITVKVTNNSGATVRPHFTMQTDSGVSSFWHRLRGPEQLAAGHTAYYLLGSPDAESQFTINDGIAVEAFLTKDPSVSVSARYDPPLWHAGYDPESFEQLIPVGTRTELRVQLLNRWDEPIKEAGVPITLGQAAAIPPQPYDSHKKLRRPKLASIDNHWRGRPATVETDGAGIATFWIVGKQASIYPDTLTATVPSGPPWNRQPTTSGTVIMRFSARGAGRGQPPATG